LNLVLPNETIEEMPSAEIVKIALAEESLLEFIKQAWHILEPTTQFQTGWHLEAICDHLEAATKRQIRNLIINMPPRHMKGCADETFVLTPNGWTTHGQLCIGDYVYHPSGKSVMVTNVSEKFDTDIVIELTNGEKIKCNGEHLWTVYNRSTRKWETRETNDLINKKVWSSNRAVFQLPETSCIDFEEKELLLHPYFIGAWLGDGTSTAPVITHDLYDVEHIRKIESVGYKVTKKIRQNGNSTRSCFTKQNIIQTIRKLNLYNNKHIPSDYKYSSKEQRLELMAGLIDTDGHVSQNGRIRICTSYKKLRDDIIEVAESLGWKPYICESESSGYEQYGDNKPHYQIGFNASCDIPLAIKRKKERLKTNHLRRKIGIKSITKSKNPEQGNCITVDSEDGLYLVGETLIPTHNSLAVSVFWPCWVWLNDPSSRWLFSSYAQELSTRDSLKCRRLLSSEWYTKRWGHKFHLTGDQNQKTRFENDKTGYRLATSVSGLVTGEGGDFIVCDDPHNVKQAESDAVRKGTLRWWDESMSTRGNNPKTVVKVVDMQRLHEADLTGHWLEKSKEDVVHLILPARFEKENKCVTVIGFEDPRTEEGEPLWKNLYDEEALTALEKDLGSEYAIAGQLQQRPSPRGGGLFAVDNFNYIDHIAPSEIVRTVRYWDKGGTDDPNNALTGGCKMHKMKNNSYIVEHVVSGLWKAPKREEMIKRVAENDGRGVTIGIEQEPGSGGLESADSTVKNLAGFSVKKDKVTGDKVTRAEPYATQIEIGNVYLLKGAWNADFVKQHELFPMGLRKDLVDCSSGAFNLLTGKGRAGTWGGKKK